MAHITTSRTSTDNNYPVSRFQNVEEELICCVCGNVPKIPAMGRCEHICCQPCLHFWLRENKSLCPAIDCRQHINLADIGAPGRIVQTLFNRLISHCEHLDKGCNEWLSWEHYNDHVANCPKAPVRCSYTGCDLVMSNEKLNAHLVICEHRDASCDKCGCALQFCNLLRHLENDCPRAELHCSCGQKIIRGERDQHRRTCRDHILVPCPVPACGRTFPQCELDAHLCSQLGTHLRMLLNTIQEKDSTIQSLNDEVSKLKLSNDNIVKRVSESRVVTETVQRSLRDLEWHGKGHWHREQDGRCIWELGNMTQRLKEASLKLNALHQGGAPYCIPELVWSPQYHTNTRGYKFSLRIDLGSSSAVGVFLHIHEGDFDEQLVWPFNLDYTLCLGERSSHITQMETYMHYSTQGRPPHMYSWGWSGFCSLDEFKEFIVKDSVEISISFVHGTPAPAQIAYPTVQAVGFHPSSNMMVTDNNNNNNNPTMVAAGATGATATGAIVRSPMTMAPHHHHHHHHHNQQIGMMMPPPSAAGGIMDQQQHHHPQQQLQQQHQMPYQQQQPQLRGGGNNNNFAPRAMFNTAEPNQQQPNQYMMPTM